MQIITKDFIIDSSTIKLSDAVKIAREFLKEISHNSSINIESAVTITKLGVPFVHVINTTNNQGFAILSADSNYTPILAYNVKGCFSINEKSLNAGIAVWLNTHSQSIDFIHNTKNSYTDSISTINKSLWKALGKKYNLSSSYSVNNLNGSIYFSNPLYITAPDDPAPPPLTTVSSLSTPLPPVGPLCGTNWDQLSPYNAYCPTTGLLGASAPSGSPNNGHWAAGCGPVAMGQIMYYWNTPNNGRYDWSVMKDLLGQGIHYIPMLLADIGSEGGAIYNIGNTGETFMDDTYAPDLFKLFGYSSAVRTTSRLEQITNPINGVAYGALLADEIINHRRPCMITATTGQINLFLGLLYAPELNFHTWVCEGDQQWNILTTYTTTSYRPYSSGAGIKSIVVTPVTSVVDYLYMNWGWGQTASVDNGFYYNSTVNYTQAINGITMNADPNQNNYLDFQTVIYNIHP